MEGKEITEHPKGWVETPLKAVVLPVEKVKPAHEFEGSFLYIDISSIDNQRNQVIEGTRFNADRAPSRARQLIHAGDVLFSTVRPYLKNIGQVPPSLDGQIASTGFSVLRPGPALDGRYLLYFCISQEFIAALEPLQRGSSYPAVRDRDVKQQSIVLPHVNEQRRIVAKIEELFSELDKGVESLKTARAQLKTYRQSLLKAAFEGRLTEQWRDDKADQLETADQLLQRIREEREARYQQQLEEWKAAVAKWEADGKSGKRPGKPAADKVCPEIEDDELEVLPRIPQAWKYVRLATVATVGSGMSVSKARRLSDPVEVPYLRVANVQRGRLMLDEIKTMAIERAALDDLCLKKWDVLFNEGGDRDKLGRGWVWEGQIDPCITQNHVFRATTYLGDEFHAKFISYWGNVFGRDYFEKVGKQTTNLASINKTVLKMFPVPVPSHDEQREIVRRLEEIESEVTMLEEQIEGGLSRSENLRQSILKRAFEGKLVPQNPDDEPASVLLERIRQEEANQPKPDRRKREAEASA